MPGVRDWYAGLAKPPGTPPDWVFRPVWLVLYLLLGVAAWRVWRHTGNGPSLRLWGWQLFANAAWAPAFFGLRSPPLGLLIMLVLWVLMALTLRAFRRVDSLSGWLLTPYAAWVSFAAYLNLGIFLLN